MKDQDLKSIWQGSSSEKMEIKELTMEQLESIAKKQSYDLFSKIKKNVIAEAVLSIIMAIAFPFFFWENQLFFWLIIIIMIISLLVGVKVYLGMWKGLDRINETSIIISLQKKVEVLDKYIRQLKVYLYIFGPIGFFLGMSLSLQHGEFSWAGAGFIFVFCLPFIALFLWLGNKYIYALYGKHFNKIKAVYQSLITKEDQD